MKKLFGGLKMTWLHLIIFAAAAGIYTGTVMLIPALENTSFQNIGINYESWVLFAVIIVVNCNKPWDAALKCFAFFLISQPLVYAVEIIFGSLGIDMALNYYCSFWLPMTLLTLPGGLVAYFCKRQNTLGAIILGLGNTIQCVMGLVYANMAANIFPRHLLSAIFCFGSVILMSLCIHEKKTNRIIAIVLPVVLTAAFAVLLALTGRTLY